MAFSAEEAERVLTGIGLENPDRLLPAIITILMDVVREHAITRKGARVLAGEVKQFREFIQQVAGAAGAGATPANNGAQVASDAPTVGADGTVLDDAQAEAERLMNAAAGPRGGEAPAAAPTSAPRRRNGRPVPQQQQQAPMVGADGTPISADQAEAERLMDEAAGPRP